jgi:hypothetical protein
VLALLKYELHEVFILLALMPYERMVSAIGGCVSLLLTDFEAGPTAATDFFSILNLSDFNLPFGCCYFCEVGV